MVTIQIDEEDLLDMLMDRVGTWTNDREVQNLYEDMYRSYVDGGVFEGAELNIMSIVDNDYINYCTVLEADEVSEEAWKQLVNLYNDGTRDISCENIEGVYGSFVEAMNEDRTMALMRA